MKVVKLSIENFRGIQSTELLFDGHTLLVGSNNVGKSTLCEALDLVLGPERLNRFPPIDEFDFYNARYLAATANGGDPAPIPLRIEAVIIGLSAEIDAKCGGHIEFWHLEERRLLGPGEIEAANPPDVAPCLRLATIGVYDIDDDEFKAKTHVRWANRATRLPPGPSRVKTRSRSAAPGSRPRCGDRRCPATTCRLPTAAEGTTG